MHDERELGSRGSVPEQGVHTGTILVLMSGGVVAYGDLEEKDVDMKMKMKMKPFALFAVALLVAAGTVALTSISAQDQPQPPKPPPPMEPGKFDRPGGPPVVISGPYAPTSPVMMVHDGFLFIFVGGTLYKVDPKKMELVGQLQVIKPPERFLDVPRRPAAGREQPKEDDDD